MAYDTFLYYFEFFWVFLNIKLHFPLYFDFEKSKKIKEMHLLLFQEKDKFDEVYTKFQSIVQQLETFLCAYLHAIFGRKMKTQEGLQFMNKLVLSLLGDNFYIVASCFARFFKQVHLKSFPFSAKTSRKKWAALN